MAAEYSVEVCRQLEEKFRRADVLRPMRYPGRVLTRGLMWTGSWTAYVRDARRNYFVWEKRFEKAWNEKRQATNHAT